MQLKILEYCQAEGIVFRTEPQGINVFKTSKGSMTVGWVCQERGGVQARVGQDATQVLQYLITGSWGSQMIGYDCTIA